VSVHLDPAWREPRWYALRTRARAEKQVDRLLGVRGVESYLPLVERERQWADRKKKVDFPLFPGYTFARFPLGRFLDVVRTPGVAEVVGGLERPTPIREEELEAVRRFTQGILDTGWVPEPVDWMEPGTPVLVAEGPFKGLRGLLLESRGRSRVAVRLSALRLAVCVDLDRTSLRRVA
jgi:transcription antitermination factor NusG